MEPGTILSIVQLSFSAFELGSKIACEFFGKNGRVPDKLRRLNDRLKEFHIIVDGVIDGAQGRSASSDLIYPGASAIVETLTECNDFLRQYELALLSDRTFGRTSQRLALVVGPDNSKIQDLDRRILDHYPALQLWKTTGLERAVMQLGESMIAKHQSSSQLSRAPTTIAESSPQPEPFGRSVEEAPISFPTTQVATPTLRAVSRNPSLPSINELPSPQVGEYSFSDAGSYRQRLSGSEAGPVLAHLRGYGRDNVTNPLTRAGTTNNTGSLSPILLSTSPTSKFRSPGYSVLFDCRVLEIAGMRVIEWINTSSRLTIQHFVPDTRVIPYTIPGDSGPYKVRFLPINARHQFKIMTIDNGTENLQEKPEYRFHRKADRENFQQAVRGCDRLEIVRAVKVHSARGKDIAMKFHLKVWRHTPQDDRPTFSFVANEIAHMEFHIRWFKRNPELRGETKLVLRLYSKGDDLVDEPEPVEPRRLSFTFGMKKLSGSSTQTNTSDSHSTSRSRSSSTKPLPLMLYEGQGIEPPDDVRNLEYLEIEFLNSEVRKSFVQACLEAHRPASEASRRNSTSSPSSQQSYQGPHELEDSGKYELPVDCGVYEMMGDSGFQIPPPSLTMPYSPGETRFNTRSLFAPSRATDYEKIQEADEYYG
ncbi:hypothetical protein F4813DRAFT_399159 [Daldinia decipiens]|uniref:uncharacterized protein n=1 Tax=Daldinia decipiens TaxID=326647 RepID=UPI0020C35598|nr:uncharacterized protein F4813DRAFT_399159 [Daldinia decipiens]KAI1654240.1 hypothetical protein F4813DRAFT_399159 [Daldinia decipiens]